MNPLQFQFQSITSLMKRLGTCSVVMMPLIACTDFAHAGPDVVNVEFTQPTLDRWNYPFAGNPGAHTYAAIFAPLTDDGFDDRFDNRDGQMLVGFATSQQVQAGLQPWQYTVSFASVTLMVELHEGFRYDPTFDSYRSWLNADDPDFEPDADPGRPIELFGTGYRWGATASTHSEHAPFSPMGQLGKRLRTAYPQASVNGQCVDVSNNVDERFDPTPFAIGINPQLTPGQLVPAGTTLTFELDVANPSVQRWLRRALSEGMMHFSIASIFASEQQQFGNYPRFYTKENKLVLAGLAQAGTLMMTVEVSPDSQPRGDVNNDGAVDVDDLLQVISNWGQCDCCGADVNFDNAVNVDDLLIVISSWGS